MGKRRDISEYTVGEVIGMYIASKTNLLSPSTIYGYQKIRRLRLQSIIDIPIARLNQMMVQNEINIMAGTLAPKTVISAYSLMHSAILAVYPIFSVKVTLPARIRQLKEPLPVETVFSIVKGTEIELPVLLSAWLSLRMSEIRGIRGKDVTKDGYLLIQNTIVDCGKISIEKPQTKTLSSTRKLKIPSYILNLIDTSKEHIVELSGQVIYKRFVRLLELNNLPHMSFHDLRHLNASVMLMLGIPDKYAMERGGWSSNNILKTAYQHTFSNERILVDEKIDKYFNDIITKQ